MTENSRLEDKWKRLATAVSGKVVTYNGDRHLYAVKGLMELEHGKIPEHIRKYHLQLPRELCHKHLILLDIETCGLPYTSPIHTISLGAINGDFLTRTFFALDYSQEEVILRRTLNLLKQAHLVFTYNETSFDIPRLSERMKARGMFKQNGHSNLKDLLGEKHIDLYTLVKMHAEGRGIALLDKRLQTLEGVLYGAHREDEVAGSEIPVAYSRFVSGSADDEEMNGHIQQMARVINHNILDVASMGAVLEDLRQNAQDIVPARMRGKV